MGQTCSHHLERRIHHAEHIHLEGLGLGQGQMDSYVQGGQPVHMNNIDHLFHHRRCEELDNQLGRVQGPDNGNTAWLEKEGRLVSFW